MGTPHLADSSLKTPALPTAPVLEPEPGEIRDTNAVIETAVAEARRRFNIGDYLSLTKPRIVLLLLVTTLIPMYLAGDAPPRGWLRTRADCTKSGEHRRPQRAPRPSA